MIQFSKNTIAYTRDDSDIYLFPNAQSKKYWTTYLSKQYACISLDNFLTLSQFQKKLQAQMSAQYEYPVRFLTMQEQEHMFRILLEQAHIQTLVCIIEQVDSIADIRQYASRLQSILNEYLIYNVNESPYTPKYSGAIQTILEAYDALLSTYQCIDTIGMSFRMSKQSSHNDTMMHCNICYPQLYNVDNMLWVARYGKDISDANFNTTTNQEHAYFSFSRFNMDTMSEGEHCPNKNPAPFWPDCLERESDNIMHIYGDFQHELDTIFAGISEIIKQTSPHNIMLALGTKDEVLDATLLLFSKKYQVPIQLQKTTAHLAKQLVSYIDDVHRSNFSPATLYPLFFEPVLSWSQESKDMNNAIITLGRNNACVNNDNLDRWFYILQKNEKAQAYFSKLSWNIKNIIQSKNFKDMYKEIDLFRKNFLDTIPKESGTDGRGKEDNSCNMVLYEIEPFISFETYLNTTHKTSVKKSKTPSPWEILKSNVGKNTNEQKKTGVQICSLTQALGSEYEYCFIANVSQQSFIKDTTPKYIFNDLLTSSLNNTHIEQKYLQYGKDILTYLKNKSTQIYMSCSEVGTTGVQLLPVYWKTKKVEKDGKYDIWKREQNIWKEYTVDYQGEESYQKPRFFITKAQKRGLEHINAIGIAAHKDTHLDTALYTYILQKHITNKGLSLHPSSITGLLNTEQFIFENIFEIDFEYGIIEPDYDVLEFLSWGSVYHKILEKAMVYEFEKIETKEPPNADDTSAYVESVLGTSVIDFLKSRGMHPILISHFETCLAKFNLKEKVYQTIEHLKNKDENGKIQVEKTKDENEDIPLFTILDNIKDFSQTTTQYKQHLDTITISGRVDLLYQMRNKQKYIIDYKRKSGESDDAYVLQLWLYYLAWNYEHIQKGSLSASLYDEKTEEFMGDLFFLFDKKTFFLFGKKAAYLEDIQKLQELQNKNPSTETERKKKEKSIKTSEKKIQKFFDVQKNMDMMPHIFNEALLRLFEYPHTGKNNMADIAPDIYADMIALYDTLTAENTVALRCILRKGGYIYAP